MSDGGHSEGPVGSSPIVGFPSASTGFDAVVLVASLGGVKALTTVLAELPASFPAPVLVVQHARAGSGGSLARVLGARCALPVHEVAHGAALPGSGVLVVPPDTSTRLTAGRTFTVEPESGLHPGDVVLGSVAQVLGARTVGVVLTGRLDDGAGGVRAVKRRGGRVLVQDPATAEARDMPSHALATGCVDFALPLERLPAALISLTMAPGGADLFTVPTPPWARLHA